MNTSKLPWGQKKLDKKSARLHGLDPSLSKGDDSAKQQRFRDTPGRVMKIDQRHAMTKKGAKKRDGERIKNLFQWGRSAAAVKSKDLIIAPSFNPNDDATAETSSTTQQSSVYRQTLPPNFPVAANHPIRRENLSTANRPSNGSGAGLSGEQFQNEQHDFLARLMQQQGGKKMPSKSPPAASIASSKDSSEFSIRRLPPKKKFGKLGFDGIEKLSIDDSEENARARVSESEVKVARKARKAIDEEMVDAQEPLGGIPRDVTIKSERKDRKRSAAGLVEFYPGTHVHIHSKKKALEAIARGEAKIAQCCTCHKRFQLDREARVLFCTNCFNLTPLRTRTRRKKNHDVPFDMLLKKSGSSDDDIEREALARTT